MSFSSINIQGNIISSDILIRIRQEDLRFQKAADFGLDQNTSVRDEIGIAWGSVQAHWKAFKLRKDRLKEGESGTSETRQGWMIPFLRELGYDLEIARAEIINEKSYAVSHKAANRDAFPVHLVGVGQSLDKRAEGGARLSPHALLQEYLNNCEHLYALTSNGRFLRLLRDATRLARLSYIEFDLERMMEEELYAEFALLFRLLHASRMPQKQDSGAESIIEFYHQEALASGTRIRERLSVAVEQSIKLLGNGLLRQQANTDLQLAAEQGTLNPDEYYIHLLRTVYRMLFLMVIEERQLIYPAERDQELDEKREVYYKFYSIQRLTKLAERKVYVDPRKTDLWRSLMTTFLLFENGFHGKKLGIQPLGSGLFSSSAIGDFVNQQMDNESLLHVIRCLVMFENENKQWTRVNYADLDVEEFGSVYEGLLEYDPQISMIHEQATFSFVEGSGRSSSGSHYTPEELVKPLIKHSLDYIIEDKLKEGQIAGADRGGSMQKQCDALLTIKVCDVACGSGHILLSAARRIGMELAILRESIASKSPVEQPSPTFLRQAIRDVIQHCIYGVDKNPLAVELCKVAFWLEAHNPGEPLNFLDHHIKCGDAIVGLAHADELNKGIASEAFKTLPGDDKEVAAAFRKQNETDIKNKGQLGAFEMQAVDLDLKNIQKLFTDFAQLPETTPEEINAKERAYAKLRSDRKISRLKELADLQIAQFFIPKTSANSDRLTTHSQYNTYLTQGSQIQDRGMSMAKAAEGRYFHWFLEFPEVFATNKNTELAEGSSGGFDCILGNPPFLAGSKVSQSFGNDYLNYLKYYFSNSGGQSDFVTYFFRRDAFLIKSTGLFCLISTNTISQGESRISCIEYLIEKGFKIHFAIKSQKWPGLAAVDISMLGISKDRTNVKYFLNQSEVAKISSFLDDNQNLSEPLQLSQNTNKSFKGVSVYGDGFILGENLYRDLITNNPKNLEGISLYLDGDDLNSYPEQLPSRFVINFQNWEEKACKEDFPELYEIIKTKVKPERDNLISDKTARENWWLYQRSRPNLYNSIRPLKRVVIISKVTRYLIFSFQTPGIVYSDATVVIALEQYSDLLILNSSFHEYWSWKYSSTMGTSTIRYTPTTAFETFPFPQNISPEQEQNLETLGEAYHEHRRQIMLGMQLGLTKTYNAFHNSELSIINDEWKRLLDALDNGLLLKEVDIKQYKFNKESIYLIKHFLKGEATIGLRKAVEGILKLRELHVQMDEAVLEAYGWGKDALQIMNDELQIVNVGKSSEAVIRKPQEKIDLRHDFYEVDYLPENDRVRFTIHPDARKEVLKRLLELNHKVYEEEIKQGLHKQEDVEKFYAQKNEAIPEEVRLLMGSKGKEKKQGSQKKQVSDGGLFGEGEV